MNVWNSVMQGLHSSLIDELNLLFPDEKLELGLPSRHVGFSPSKKATHACLSRVSVSEGFGLVFLGHAAHQKSGAIQPLLKKVIDRAAKNEFPRRGIVPQFGKFQDVTLSKLPSDIPAIQMVIWLPISVPVGKNIDLFDLGVAV